MKITFFFFMYVFMFSSSLLAGGSCHALFEKISTSRVSTKGTAFIYEQHHREELVDLISMIATSGSPAKARENIENGLITMVSESGFNLKKLEINDISRVEHSKMFSPDSMELRSKLFFLKPYLELLIYQLNNEVSKVPSWDLFQKRNLEKRRNRLVQAIQENIDPTWDISRLQTLDSEVLQIEQTSRRLLLLPPQS
ncbi:MAG: hypothetical protein V4596_14560 [Bdellovibrionota bacterium]